MNSNNLIEIKETSTLRKSDDAKRIRLKTRGGKTDYKWVNNCMHSRVYKTELSQW